MRLEDLLIDDVERGVFRVHRSTMTSQALFELERERIFARRWLYVGHESEVPRPGDFQRRQAAGRPLIFVRGSDGVVRVLLNSCRHRGALVCRAQAGSAETFSCFYHGWTYDNLGALVGLPDAGAYAPSFDRSAMALVSPPRVESYRGFYFAAFDRDAPPVAAWLGQAATFIDMVADQAAAGIRVLPAAIRYGIRANWKLMAENSVDSYHVPSLHQSYLRFMAGQGVTVSRPKGASWGMDLGHGHGAFSGQVRSVGLYGGAVSRLGDATKAGLERIRERQVARYGEERSDWAPGRVNFLVYPSCAFVGMTTLRAIFPLSPERTEISTWVIVPADEAGEALAARVNDIPLFQGPGGFASPDDVEAMESCQAGFAAREVEWTDLSRGMQRTPRDSDEVQIRAFWRQWHADLLGIAAANAEDRADAPGGGV